MDLLNDVKYSAITDKNDVRTDLQHSAHILNSELNEFTHISEDIILTKFNYINKLNRRGFVRLGNEYNPGEVITIINDTEFLLDIRANPLVYSQQLIGDQSTELKIHSNELFGSLYPNGSIIKIYVSENNSLFMIISSKGFELNNKYMKKLTHRFRIANLSGYIDNNDPIPCWLEDNGSLCFKSDSYPLLIKNSHSTYINFQEPHMYLELKGWEIKQPNTFIFVARSNISGGIITLLDTNEISQATQRCTRTADKKLSMYGGHVITQTDPAPDVLNKFHILEFVFNKDQSNIYVDGVRSKLDGNDVGINDIITGIILGNAYTKNVAYSLDIKEFVMLEGVLDDTEREIIINNYKNIYNIPYSEY